jgi:hypothetical protein
MGEKN